MTDGIERVREVFASAEDVEPIEGLVPDAGKMVDDAAPPAPPEGESPDRVPVFERCALLPLNDTGNGARFNAYFEDEALHVPRVGWHLWDGTRWRLDDDDLAVRRMAQKVGPMIESEAALLALTAGQMRARQHAQQIIDELAALDEMDDGQRQRLGNARATIGQLDTLLQKRRASHRRHANASGNSGPIRNMLTEAAPHVSASLDDLDVDPMLVNCANGTLRFWSKPELLDSLRDDGCRDFEEAGAVGYDFTPHDKADRLTKCLNAAYDPTASAPEFMRFLRTIQPDGAMRDFIQRWFGYSMLGLTHEQKLAFFYGGGRNGKSTLVDLVARVMADYSATAKIESLTGDGKRKASEATPDLVPLIGARFVRASEPEQGERLKSGLIKELTGGEPIMVRALNKDFVTVTPRFKMTISGNHKPDIRDLDEGIWRRINLVDFPVEIAKSEIDRKLPEKLWAERSGVLNWLIEGTLAYLAQGLMEPESVNQATAEFRAESDPMGKFLAECTIFTNDPEDKIRTRDMTEAYLDWQTISSASKWAAGTISNRLVEKVERRWRHPKTGHMLAKAKASNWYYVGVIFTPEFLAERAALAEEKRGSK